MMKQWALRQMNHSLVAEGDQLSLLTSLACCHCVGMK